MLAPLMALGNMGEPLSMGAGKVCVLRICTGTCAFWIYTEECVVDEAWDECMEVGRDCGSKQALWADVRRECVYTRCM